MPIPLQTACDPESPKNTPSGPSSVWLAPLRPPPSWSPPARLGNGRNTSTGAASATTQNCRK